VFQQDILKGKESRPAFATQAYLLFRLAIYKETCSKENGPKKAAAQQGKRPASLATIVAFEECV
jgi:hypothetical protein